MLRQGSMIGLEDVMNGHSTYSYTLQCKSNTGLVLVLQGKKLKDVEKISKVYSQMLETTAENSMVIEKAFSKCVKTRSRFRKGKVFSTVTDPDNFLSFSKLKEEVELDKEESKWDQINKKIDVNMEKIQENK